MTLFTCVCCGYKTITVQSNHEICPLCSRQDDGTTYSDPDFISWANYISLRTAQKQFYKKVDTTSNKYEKDPSRTPLTTLCEITYATTPLLENAIIITLSWYLSKHELFTTIAKTLAYPDQQSLTREAMSSHLHDLSRLEIKNIVLHHQDDFMLDDLLREDYIAMLDDLCSYWRQHTWDSCCVFQVVFPTDMQQDVENTLNK